MNFSHRLTCVLAAGLVLGGCSEDDPYADARELSGPVSTHSALAWIDQDRSELLFVRPGDDDIDVAYRKVGDDRTRVSWLRPTLDGDELLAMVVPSSQKEEDVEERLFVFPADGSGDARSYDVLAPFSTVDLSPDRRRAVLHFGSGTDGFGGAGVLQNANQVSIVTLDSPEPPRSFTLNGFGGRLTRVEFPGQTTPGEPGLIQIGNRLRDIVAFLADNEVVLVDMEDPVANQVAVNIGSITFTPERTLLRPPNDKFDDPVLFLRSSTSSDVAMLTLAPKVDDDGFTAQVSLLPIGTQASDFVTHDGDEVPYLVTIDPAREALAFTDIRTQQGFGVALGGPASRMFTRTHESDAGPIDQLVMWGPGGSTIYTLELDGIDDALGRSPRPLGIQTGIEDLVVLDNDRVLVGSGINLYVVDFTVEQVTPLSSPTAYDATNSALEGNLLLLGTSAQPWISTVDLTTLDPESMVLDDPISSFHYLSAVGKVVAVHPDPVGHISVAQAGAPTRSSTYAAWGFLYADILERN
ncbi:MAG: hypothetical protein ACE37F_14940 [Nannocystaceae bacterium]|nr:hypothetical protein [bacterium]